MVSNLVGHLAAQKAVRKALYSAELRVGRWVDSKEAMRAVH